jgi:hypothetical protein
LDQPFFQPTRFRSDAKASILEGGGGIIFVESTLSAHAQLQRFKGN